MGRRAEIAETQAARIVSGIWRAVWDPQGWDTLLPEICDAFEASSGKAAILDTRSGRAAVLASHRIDPEISRRWEEGVGGRDLWAEAGLARMRTGETTATGAQLVAPEEYRRSTIYHEVSRPSDHEDVLASALALDGERIAFLSVFRGADEGTFDRSDVKAYEELTGQLRSALTLQGEALRDTAARASLASLHVPALVCDTAGRIVAANADAEALLREGDGVRVMAGTLRATVPADDHLLQQALRRATAAVRDPQAIAGGTTLALRRPERASLGVRVAPLPGGSPVFALAEMRVGAAVLVALSDPEAQPRLPEDELRTLFGFTPAEARMAAALGRGLSRAEYAEQAGISQETARSRLKVLFRKTAVRRQAELVRMLLTSVAARVPGDR